MDRFLALAATRAQMVPRGTGSGLPGVLVFLLIACVLVGGRPAPAVEETGTSEANIEAPQGVAAQEIAALRKMDAEWLKAFEGKDLERMVSFYADDAALFPPNAPVVSGREAIREFWEEMVANPGFGLTWEVVKEEMAASGDLAWVRETYALLLQDPEGKLQEDRGKAVLVWKKQPDGSWKAVADIFNSDLPLAGAGE